MKTLIILAALITMSLTASAQPPQIGTGVSHELAKWRAARYSDVRYKLNLTLEKMSPVLKGTMEVRVRVIEGRPGRAAPSVVKVEGADVPGTILPPPAIIDVPIIIDWRRIRGHEDKSIVSNVSINGKSAFLAASVNTPPAQSGGHPSLDKEGSGPLSYVEQNEHLIFRDGVVAGENVIKLDFTSPILPSGSAITRYVDKEDGAEYIYSLFVPSDASTAFPVFDQPDLKARFELYVVGPKDWKVISNSPTRESDTAFIGGKQFTLPGTLFVETKRISTYVFAFAAGPWEKVSSAGAADKSVPPAVAGGLTRSTSNSGTSTEPSIVPTSTSGGVQPPATAGGTDKAAVSDGRRHPVATARGTDSTADLSTSIYVRKSQAAKFKPHAAEVFRLNREAVKYFEQYFDYEFPFPKYDLVLIPEFPFGGMEHAGATFLRESSIIFPQEPTKNDLVSRATLIFHEAAHQWFGDTVTMRWFDDLWLKEGFATFTAYKAMEKIMPEMNAWKVFYERIKQGAYQTDATKGTTPIYQEIKNLSAAKSAYGNIVYNKAPAFLRQAEFYLGEDKFQTAVRAFLKKHEFGNAGWEDLVKEFEASSKQNLREWAEGWVRRPGLFKSRFSYGLSGDVRINKGGPIGGISEEHSFERDAYQERKFRMFVVYRSGFQEVTEYQPYSDLKKTSSQTTRNDYLFFLKEEPLLVFPNYGDYGYGIFLLDEKSRDYVLKNIQNEKDPFLRTMMWGALWDSVREGELDPQVFVELVVKVLRSPPKAENHPVAEAATPLLRKEGSKIEEDESTIATLLGRTGTALNYYIDDAERVGSPHVSKGSTSNKGRVEPSLTIGLRTRVEDLLIERMQNAPGLGQRITYYRALLNVAASEKAREVLKGLLKAGTTGGNASVNERASSPAPDARSLTVASLPVRTKDKFDIATRLLILNDPEAPKLLADLEKTETSDEAKRYAYAARAGIGTAENKAKYWKDFTENKEISESWIEAAFGPWNSIRHSELTLPYLERALRELPNHKRSRKIFFVNGWLGAFIGGQRSAESLAIVNKFLADNPGLDNDLRLKILENVDLIERAVNIRRKFPQV